MAETEPGMGLPEIPKPVHTTLDPEAERARDPREKLREFQGVLIRLEQISEVLMGATTVPDLEVMAAQSTKDLEGLLRDRLEQPIEGPSRQISFIELGPRDDELSGLAAMQDMLHGIFLSRFDGYATDEYQARVPFDPQTQTIDEYMAAQAVYARARADAMCSEVCPSSEELRAKARGSKSHERFLARRKAMRDTAKGDRF